MGSEEDALHIGIATAQGADGCIPKV
ncbi:hypothetical protein GMMP1_340012 [Candidatus Magnetomoraceae bacterium gMMP-1]